MKKIFLAIMMVQAVAFARGTGDVGSVDKTELKNDADYVTEVGMLIIKGQVAEDLYNSLKAKEIADKLNTNWQAVYKKENKYASCKIVQYRYETEENGSEWLTESAECRLKAPAGSVEVE